MKKKFKNDDGYSGLQKCCIMMKSVILLMLLTVLQVRAEVKSQEVLLNLKMADVSFEKVLKIIESQTEYTCLYSYDDVVKVDHLNLDFENATLRTILEKCVKGTDLQYKVVDQTIVIRSLPKNAVQQEKREKVVNGRVTDNRLNPLPGVTILIKDTKLGVVADAMGQFKIAYPEDMKVTLIFSFIGMKNREIEITTQQSVEVTLEEDVTALEDVVVTGYSNVRKSSFTGNATTVNREQLLRTNNKNVISALQTFDPSFRIKENALWGSDPNALPEFNIRGESSIGMNKSLEQENLKQSQRTGLKDNPNLPIFILDGFEVSVQKIYDMDMNRIESMTILKDAAATAMYGSRAANGVVVVTTTAPKAGEMQVSYNATLSFELPDLSDYNLCNAAEKLETEKLSGLYVGETPGLQVQKDLEYNKIQQRILRGVNTDWLAQPLRNAVNHQHSVYVNGGVESIRYAIDFNYNGNKGAMKGSYRNTTGAGLALDYRYRKLQIRNYISYSSTRSEDSPYGAFSDYAKMQPYNEIKDENGQYLRKIEGFRSIVNPLFKTTLGNYNGKTTLNDLTNNLNAILNILEGLQFRGEFSISTQNNTAESFEDPKDPIFDEVKDEKEKGALSKNWGKNNSWNLNAMLYFNRQFGRHFINATAGANAREGKSELNSILLKGFQLGNLNAPAYAAQQPDKTYCSAEASRLIGLLASLNYAFDDIYLLDASFRLDGSSQFGADKRFAPFWSVGTGINFHNYSWLEENRYINTFRIRASYGSTGKVNFPPYTAITTYNADSKNWYYAIPATYLFYLGNPDLKWETTRTLDAGFELGLFRDIVYLKASYYHKETIDLIDEVAVRTSSGFPAYRSNSGSVVNKGFELSLNATAFHNDDWRVVLTGNLASNKNEITELGAASEEYNRKLDENYDAKDPAYRSLTTRPLQKYKKGASTTAIYAVRSAGIDPANGREKFIKKNGMSTYTWCADDQVVVGDLLPDAQGSFGVNASFRGFYLNASFMYQWGGQTYNSTLLEKVENADIRNANVDKRVLTERWKKPGDIAPYYDLEASAITKPTSRFVQDYNYLSFSSLSAGYDFKKEMLRKCRLTALGIRMNANDLCRWSSVAEERGTSYPYARNFSITLNIGF